MLELLVSDGTPAIGINKMEIAIILTDVVIKIILLALIIFCGAVLAAILWVVYVYYKDDKDGNKI